MRRVAKRSIKSASADKSFSLFIRTRDPMCRRCIFKPSSDCSHFWGRGNSGTRYDPKNCIGLCRPCHDYWEHQKNNEYKEWMLKWLGPKEYELLERRARGFKKRSDAVLEWLEAQKAYKEIPQVLEG